ncbi:MAG: SDR family NAD(P)-dependent oxidoreductase [Lachnospiraceae bacterium]|nr:SDR family NAD(P)-dependent oxidoreductase [Lachnospiraceae bacterium]
MSYVLITGASRGIGKATALKLAAAGYNLILICHKNTELLDDVARQSKEFGVSVITFTGDISKEDTCNAILSSLKEQNIYPDILINNAGISHIGLFQDMSLRQWNEVIETNLNSMFLCCKLVIPSMLNNKKGKIINISSVWGNVGASCEVAYSASKGAVNSFTKALAKELAPSNIQVNAIAFGAIDTQMNNHLSPEDKTSLCEEIPMGRMGTVDEAANMILSLISSPDYLTGQIIAMDGGWI